MRRACGLLAVAMITIAATPTSFGGWAVVTFHDFPEYLQAGTPTTLTFEIRQHGQTPRPDVSPSLTLRDSDASWVSKLFDRDRITARYNAASGEYEATVSPREAGRFLIHVDTDVHGWTTKTLPLRVVAAGTTPAPLIPFERGQQLFVATGCVSCHAKRDDPALVDMTTIQVGPALTGRVFEPTLLASKLANPATYRVTGFGDLMPNLGLRDSEVQALVAYLGGGTGVISSGSK